MQKLKTIQACELTPRALEYVTKDTCELTLLELTKQIFLGSRKDIV